MGLPDLIEIVPLPAPVKAEVTVPGSKSITNRALVLAALAHGTVTLEGALWSEDTQVMVECLHTLGFKVEVQPDPNEFCNRTITVEGKGGLIPKSGTVEKPLELFVGNAGTAARFLAALVCLGQGVYRLSGVPRMHERPQASLFEALRQLGYRIDSANNKLPAVIHSSGPKAGSCAVSVDESSQFASALILSGTIGQWQLQINGANHEELPYVEMTRQLVKTFPKNGGVFEIEPDASSGSYFWAADTAVAHWPQSGWQIDGEFPKLLPLPAEVSRESDLGDSIMTAIVLAPFLSAPVKFTELGRLRVQECERVVALRTELTKCGAKVIEEGDALTVYPSQLHGAEIETYNDHRMAMCFAVVGLRVPGIKLRNPSCVKKTFPNFFQKLAKDLGVTILDAHGKELGHEDLFAA
ncbi:MAG: 3-phosphoshikimate 1-carboxyvinyltransferase [Verrucomicrobia bacterium]|nr:3-phosphoshikimate 1-carboxyvinyltransferase [Verrucomicrobiota bacterium]